MKILNKLMMGAAALVLLTGCSSAKSVDVKTFTEKAEEAWKNVPYTKVVVNGTISFQIESDVQEIKIKDIELPLKDGALDTDKAQEIDVTEENVIQYEMASLMVSMNAYYVGQSYGDILENSEASKGVEAKFYVGNGFKVTLKEDGNSATLVWDKYGMMTKMDQKTPDSGSMSLTAKYSK